MKTIVKKELNENFIPTPLKTRTQFVVKEFKCNNEKRINYKCDCNIEINKKHKENCIYNLV